MTSALKLQARNTKELSKYASRSTRIYSAFAKTSFVLFVLSLFDFSDIF